MGSKRTLALGLLLVAVALAGCTQQGGPETYSLTVEDAPGQVGLGEDVTVRWSIEGPEASTDHAGIHFGLTQTTGRAQVTADAFDATAPHTSSELPGTAETTFNVTFPGTIYYRTHVTVDGESHWGDERVLQVTGTPVEMRSVPRTVEAGSNATVRWRVHHIAPMDIPHTAIHYGSESHDEDTEGGNPFAYGQDTFTPKPAHAGQIPASFGAEIPAPKPGTIHFRGHAVIGGTNWLSAEHSIRVQNPSEPNVVVLEAPDRVDEGDTFNVTFQANHPQNNTLVDHVGVDWDSQSHGANASRYPNGSHKGLGETPTTIPGEFTVELTAASVERMHLRAHVRTVNGTDVLSPEHVVDVSRGTAVQVTDAPSCVELSGGEADVNATFEVQGTSQRSDHVGIHFDDPGNHSGDEDSADDYARAGPHSPGQVPGTFERHFTATETGTHHFVGHAELASGSVISADHTVEVESGSYAC